jgi:hypothetical protein
MQQIAAIISPESSRAMGQRKLILAQAWMMSREIHLAPVAIALKRAVLYSTVLRWLTTEDWLHMPYPAERCTSCKERLRDANLMKQSHPKSRRWNSIFAMCYLAWRWIESHFASRDAFL